MNIAEKLIKIAENEQKVYNEGYDVGRSDGYGNGYTEGYEKGKSEGDAAVAYEQGVADGYEEAEAVTMALIDRSITELVIPVGTKHIGANALAYAARLTKLTIPEGVEWIGSSALSYMGQMKKIDFPLSCKSITSYSMQGSSNLECIRFGDTREIQICACQRLGKCVTYDFSRNTSVPTLTNTNAFDGINASAKIIVPDSLYDEWIEATNWVAYKDYIVAIDAKAAPDQSKFNVYVDANTLQEIVNYDVLGIKLGHGVGENYIRNDGGVPYLRIHGDGTSNEAYAIVQNVNKQKSGKYLVYAYRIPTSNTNSGQHYFQIYANTTNDTPSGKGDMFYVRTQQDGKWHVDIIDIEAAINSSPSVVKDKNPSKFTPSNDGEYIAQKLRFDWFNVDWAYGKIPTSDYIDIAYIGLCDSLELARAADPDYTGKEFSLEYFASRLGSEIKVTEHGMKYAVVNSTTDNSGESWIWLSEDNYEEYRIIPNTTMYVGVLYKDAPVRANGKGAWGEIYACSANDSLTNSSWYSLGRIDPYDTSSGWHFGIMKFKAPLADAACRLMRFDFFNGLSANTTYSMNIAFVKCFTSEEEANAYYQSYKTRYNI